MGNLPWKWKGWMLPIPTSCQTKIGWKRLDLLHKQLIYPWKHIMRTENHQSGYHISRMYVVLHTFGVLKNTSCCFIPCKTAMTPWNLTLKKQKKLKQRPKRIHQKNENAPPSKGYHGHWKSSLRPTRPTVAWLSWLVVDVKHWKSSPILRVKIYGCFQK